MIRYNKLWEILADRNMPNTILRDQKIVLGQSFTNLRKGESMTMKTLDRLCAFLGCQPGDILEYVPDRPEGPEGQTNQK